MKKYVYLGKAGGKRFCINGVDVLSRSWRSLGECDIVIDPSTGKPYSFSKYCIDTASARVVFLAGKFDGDEENAFFKEATEEDFIF